MSKIDRTITSLSLSKKSISVAFSLFTYSCLISHNGIYNQTFSTQLGDHLTTFVLAKILSIKYNIPFYYVPFKYSDLFVFDDSETLLNRHSFKQCIPVSNEKHITDNLHRENVLFYTNFQTIIDCIHPEWIRKIREILKLKNTPPVNTLPKNTITIAVHIRKANGGGERNEGKQISQQYFDFDQSLVEYVYINNIAQFPYDWITFIRFTKGSYRIQSSYLNPNGILPSPGELAFDTTKISTENNPYYSNYPLDHGCPIKYVPDQYYVDQIKKISNDLGNLPLFVQLFTDDATPLALVTKIKNAVNKPNITFHYENNREYSYKNQVAQDLYNMSRFDILIRSHSYFAKTAEFIGNHKLVIFPIAHQWLTPSKLIITTSVIKANLNATACDFIESNKIYSHLFKDKNSILQADTKNEKGIAPLHIAAKTGNIYIVKSAAHSCANIDIQDINGNTPLMHAIINGHTEIAKYLLKYNARVAIKNDNNLTALEIAKVKGNTEIVKLILEATKFSSF